MLKNRYELQKRIGGGTFGETSLAWDHRDASYTTGRQCVVKRLHYQGTAETLAIAITLFEREAATLQTLGQHPQIPELYDSFREGGEFYIFQEHIDGQPLLAELQDDQGNPRRLTADQTVRLLQEILVVLRVVHGNGIIHRDLKPENIMRRRGDGKVVLIDFGAVKQVSSVLGDGSSTVNVGTAGYMPAEQAMGKPKFASDIYAMGMLGLQCLTGIHPKELQEHPQTGEIDWAAHQRTLRPDLVRVLDRMIIYDFRQRYGDAGQAVVALGQLGVKPVAVRYPSREPSPRDDSNQRFSSDELRRRRDRERGGTQPAPKPPPPKPTLWDRWRTWLVTVGLPAVAQILGAVALALYQGGAGVVQGLGDLGNRWWRAGRWNLLLWGWLLALGLSFGGLGVQWAGIALVWLADASGAVGAVVYTLLALFLGCGLLAAPNATEKDSAIGAVAVAWVVAWAVAVAGVVAWVVAEAEAWAVAVAVAVAEAGAGAWVVAVAWAWAVAMAGVVAWAVAGVVAVAVAGAVAVAVAGAWATDQGLFSEVSFVAMLATQLGLSVLSYGWAIAQPQNDSPRLSWSMLLISLLASFGTFYWLLQQNKALIITGIYLGLGFGLVIAMVTASLVGAGKRLHLRTLPRSPGSPKAFPYYTQRLTLLVVPSVLGFWLGWQAYPSFPWADLIRP